VWLTGFSGAGMLDKAMELAEALNVLLGDVTGVVESLGDAVEVVSGHLMARPGS
jgi:hypothetical protein